jgi:hypothetical protein
MVRALGLGLWAFVVHMFAAAARMAKHNTKYLESFEYCWFSIGG